VVAICGVTLAIAYSYFLSKRHTSLSSGGGDLQEETRDGGNEVLKIFHDAVEKVKGLDVADVETRLRLYGLYKRVLLGKPDPGSKPWEPMGRAKWNAWNDCRDLGLEEAILLYVETVNNIADLLAVGEKSKKPTIGPKVSKMMSMPTENTAVTEFPDSKFFDEIRDDFSKLPELLKAHPQLISARDEENRTLLHWAVDSDCFEAVFLLAEHGAELDVKDNDGFTPLGYAASSNLNDIAIFLVSAGANVNIASNEMTAMELTKDSSLQEMLSKKA